MFVRSTHSHSEPLGFTARSSRLARADEFCDVVDDDLPSSGDTSGDAVVDDVETYLKVLEGIGHPDRFFPLLAPDVTIDDYDGNGLSRAERHAFIGRILSSHEAGLRGRVVSSDLAGDRMMVAWRVIVPAGVFVDGAHDGDVAWTAFRLAFGRIAHISRCVDEHHAMAELNLHR